MLQVLPKLLLRLPNRAEGNARQGLGARLDGSKPGDHLQHLGGGQLVREGGGLEEGGGGAQWGGHLSGGVQQVL